MYAVKIDNLNFNFGNKVLFKNLNLKIKTNTWNTILGNNGAGKTTLLKIIVGLIESNNIFIDNIKLNKSNKLDIRKKIGCVFENVENNLVCDTVLEELSFPLENLGLSQEEIELRIDNIINLFDFLPGKNQSIDSLTIDEKQVLAIMVSLIYNPKILILDEAFSYVNKLKKIQVMNILKKLNITIINVTHDAEELLYSDNIIVLKDGNVFMNDTIDNVFKDDKIDNLPFIVELSKKLKYYELVDDISYSYKELVEKIWK